ncbi:hypothetical protein GRI40_12685 [Altererythrobacter aerius]|uniref:Uncharacterized protein n=1 Tax=Tsuneonella aeria TaxID=1837929 RepID=A0A6I4TFK2_9SPHN|nr:hypothetical protein [Tsuneonella aeria]MXO76072.1 hypothetical protein [Tsuneonella aeria]
MRITVFLPIAAALLASCNASPQPGAGAGGALPGNADDNRPFDGITAEETFRFTGTEPFWGGSVAGKSLTYSTPENIDGISFPVERFAGRGGVSWSGVLEGKAFRMTATPGDCSDGMSDRTYPFTVTLMIGEEQRRGCGWTQRQPYSPDQV